MLRKLISTAFVSLPVKAPGLLCSVAERDLHAKCSYSLMTSYISSTSLMSSKAVANAAELSAFKLNRSYHFTGGEKPVYKQSKEELFRPDQEWIIDKMHKTGPILKTRNRTPPLDGKPMMKGVVLKTLVKKPKKPNSANRKCVLVRLSSGREMVAYVPGEGHNLQEHNIVLCRVGRLRDVPGVKIKCIRGKYDLAHVIKKN